ncbi:zinc finger protein draculin-like [Culex pipiens pallens]|uniref:zinc finger protein draculin-like n=1 Tax=Culex pipiens pallens TaxID=42434 RepID=UPI001954A9F5|nr:zinc finger protein draculin-like [Culex pipiens pallens]XP_039452033.1 zinc finger protein draculin-like [Culex pipiens pallens]XP_039452034.1 zinc finger protein draculin-like [Culex pipiens pallens]
MADTLEIKVLETEPKPVGPDDFCRLCLEANPELISLMSHIGENSVPKMFVFLTGLEIDFDDDYPKVACTTCFTRLEQAYRTRKDFLDCFSTLISMTVEPDPTGGDKDLLEECAFTNEIILKEEIISEASDVEIVPEVRKRGRPKGTAALKTVKVTGKKMKPTNVDPSTETDDVDSNEEGRSKKKKRRGTETKEQQIARRKFSSMDPNKCYICQEVFESIRELNVHLPQHMDMLPYTCELCLNGNGPQKEKIASLVLLHRHVRMHSGNVPCPKCPYKLFGINRMYNHVKHSHRDGGKEYICETCGSKLPNKNAFGAHMLRHKYIEEGRYTCEICGAKFGNNPRLERHMLGHKDKEFQCQYCDKHYPSKTLLLTHEREHAGKALFICVTCEEQFPSREKRFHHINEAHPEVAKANRENEKLHYGKKNPGSGRKRKFEKPDSFPCDFEGCDYVGRTYGNLHYHKQKHRLRFVCQWCPKRFPTKQLCTVHEVVHTGEKSFMCDQCDKCYTQINCLRRHQITHVENAPKPYVCFDCGEAFTTKPRLDNHALRHSEPQHQCEICQRSFRYKGDWTRHMKQHEEGKLVGQVAKIEEVC